MAVAPFGSAASATEARPTASMPDAVSAKTRRTIRDLTLCTLRGDTNDRHYPLVRAGAMTDDRLRLPPRTGRCLLIACLALCLAACGSSSGPASAPVLRTASPGLRTTPAPASTSTPGKASSPAFSPASSNSAFPFTADAVVGFYQSEGLTCGPAVPSTVAAGWSVRNCQGDDPSGRDIAIGVMTDQTGALGAGFASVTALPEEELLAPTDALDALSGFLGAMLDEANATEQPRPGSPGISAMSTPRQRAPGTRSPPTPKLRTTPRASTSKSTRRPISRHRHHPDRGSRAPRYRTSVAFPTSAGRLYGRPKQGALIWRLSAASRRRPPSDLIDSTIRLVRRSVSRNCARRSDGAPRHAAGKYWGCKNVSATNDPAGRSLYLTSLPGGAYARAHS